MVVAIMVGIFILVVLAVGVPLGIILRGLGSNSGAPDSAVVPVFFSPGDTRIVSFDSSSCDEVTLVVNSRRTEATLYLITDTPPLTDQNNFTISSSLSLTDNIYNYWNYYLYPGSNFSTTVRTRLGSDKGTFYLFKGRNNFQQWIKNPLRNEAITTFSITCFSRPFSRQLSFLVQDEDEYYLVYYNNRGQCSRSSSDVLRLDVTISVNRFQYSTSNLTTDASCSAIEGQCSLNVPSDSNYRALIATDIPDNPDWEENVDISLLCSSNTTQSMVKI